MTTYRKDVKEQRALINMDSFKLQNELWARTNCLLGFTVISILIGCVALAISILLLLQSFELAGLENAKVADLEMRIKYLEHLTENMQPLRDENNDIDIERPVGVQGGPQPPPIPPQTQPPPVPATMKPRTEISRSNGETAVDDIFADVNDIEDEPRGNADTGRRMRPYIPPLDDDDDYSGGFEGSGDDCPVNPPRPVCPMGMRMCETKERCPKIVCCM